jgi:hypothetical protein
MKKSAYMGAALAGVLLFLGCPTGNGAGSSPDVWSKVASIDEIIGTWEGSSFYTMPAMPLDGLTGQAGTAGMPPSTTLPASVVKYTVWMRVDETSIETVVTLDFNQYLDDIVTKSFGGMIPKQVLWALIKASIVDSLNDPNYGGIAGSEIQSIEPDDNCRIVITSNPLPVSEMDFSGETAPSINQHKNKLKASADMPAAAAPAEKQEIILYKKS